MSKIKDLVAEVNNIDDLKPEPHKYDKAFYDAVRAETIKRIGEQVYAKTLHWGDLREWLRGNAEYTTEEEENDYGKKATIWHFENFTDLCWEACEDTLNDYIEDQHLDLTDKEYSDILYYARDWLADALSDFESECIQDMLSDKKYELDELAERNGQC